MTGPWLYPRWGDEATLPVPRLVRWRWIPWGWFLRSIDGSFDVTNPETPQGPWTSDPVDHGAMDLSRWLFLLALVGVACWMDRAFHGLLQAAAKGPAPLPVDPYDPYGERVPGGPTYDLRAPAPPCPPCPSGPKGTLWPGVERRGMERNAAEGLRSEDWDNRVEGPYRPLMACAPERPFRAPWDGKRSRANARKRARGAAGFPARGPRAPGWEAYGAVDGRDARGWGVFPYDGDLWAPHGVQRPPSYAGGPPADDVAGWGGRSPPPPGNPPDDDGGGDDAWRVGGPPPGPWASRGRFLWTPWGPHGGKGP